MNVVGLFAGIGGFELGFAAAGHETRLLCEINPAADAVLAARFPEIPRAADVRSLDALPEETEIVVAGFPCQDLSQAGKTVGIDGARSGLVGEVFRLLRRRPVPWVVLENVPFMLQLARGQALRQIVTALEEMGYRWAYRVVDSNAFGLAQRRERVFIVASLDADPRGVLLADSVAPERRSTALGQLAHGFYWTEGIRGLGWAIDAVPTLKNGSTVGIPSPPAILLPDGVIIKPDIRDAERLQGFARGWTEPAEAVVRPGFRWSLVGNAVTVDVATWLGRRLVKPGRYDAARDVALGPASAWPKAAWFDGRIRAAAEVSTWPVAAMRRSLHEFLEFPGTPLSVRATAGFLARARSSSLRFPGGFLDAVERHLAVMRDGEAEGGRGGRPSASRLPQRRERPPRVAVAGD